MTSTIDLNNKLSDPALLPDILATVATGGTLVRYCQDKDLDYKAVNRWLADDADRQTRYKLALSIREDHARDLIIAELIAWIKADLTQCFDEDGNMKTMHQMGQNERKLISGWRFKEIFEMQDDPDSVGPRGGTKRKQVHIGNIIEVKLWDKVRSIETFMKNLAMLVDRKQVDVGQTLADLIAGSMAKPKEPPKEQPQQEKPDA